MGAAQPAGAPAKKHWKTSGVSAYAPKGIQHSGWTYKIPASFTELANDVLGNFTNILWYGAEGCEYSGLTHGDPRIDNWFFYENKFLQKVIPKLKKAPILNPMKHHLLPTNPIERKQ